MYLTVTVSVASQNILDNLIFIKQLWLTINHDVGIVWKSFGCIDTLFLICCQGYDVKKTKKISNFLKIA